MAAKPIQQNPAGCYVYSILVDGLVRYVGKGTRYRISRHLQAAKNINVRRAAGETVQALKFHNRLAKAMRAGAVIECRKIIETLSSDEALEREIKEIAAAPIGQLWNETRGGDGVDSEFATKLWSDPCYRSKMNAIRTTDEFRQRARKKNIAHFANPEERKKSRARTSALWEDSGFRERGTKALRAVWESAEFREKHKRGIARAWAEHPERRAARAEIGRAYSSRPGYRERTGERFRELWKDAEFRKRATAHWVDPERKKAIVASWSPEFLKKRGRAIAEGHAKSEASQKRFSDPALRERLRTASNTYWGSSEARLRHSAKMKALWADPEHRAKTTAHWAEKRKLKHDRSQASSSVLPE